MTEKKKTTPRPSRRSRTPSKLDLEGQLAELENAQLVRRLTEGELAYLFKHTLTQETAYESLLLKKRREIHLRVAHLYEEYYPGRLDEFAAMLAQHYSEGGDDAKTLEYETRAGDVAARRYANAEALSAYTHALEIAKRKRGTESALIRDLYLKLGRVLELSGKYKEAVATYDEMETTARGRNDRGLELASLMARATLLATPTPVHDPKRAHGELERALSLARELEDPVAEAKGLWNLMILSKFGWHPAEAVKYGEQSLAIARKFNLREQMAYTLNDLAVHGYMDSGAFQNGLTSIREARQLWRELDNQPMLADSLSSSAMTNALLGKFDEAIQEGNEARQISERIGNLWGQSYSRFVEGDIRLERGEIDVAIKIMEECIDLGDRAGFVVPSVWVRSNLALLYGKLGGIGKGVELCRQAMESAEARLPSWRAMPLAILARLEAWRGNIRGAEEALESTHIGSEDEYLFNLLLQMGGALALARAEVALAKGDTVSTEAIIAKLITRIKDTGGRYLVAEALYVRAKAALAAGRTDDARLALTEACTGAEEIGSNFVLWRTLAAMARIEEQSGNNDRSNELRKRAREIVENIAAHTPTDLRKLFVSTPEVGDLLHQG